MGSMGLIGMAQCWLDVYPNPSVDSCPRKNRVKQDDIYVELPLFELEIRYGGTEAGRRFYFLASQCFWSYFAPCIYNMFNCLPGTLSKISRSLRKEGPIHLARHGPCMASSSAMILSSLQSCFCQFHQNPWLCQFRNNPKYRVYKVYKFTEHKSGPGLVVSILAFTLAIFLQGFPSVGWWYCKKFETLGCHELWKIITTIQLFSF